MGRILKSDGRVVPAEVLDAREQAAAILAAAHARAEDLRRETEAERRQARDRGQREGHDAGRNDAAAEVTETLAAVALEAARVRARAEAPALQLAARLAARMAEKIVGRAIDTAPEVMVGLVEQALIASRARAGVIRLRIHPEDRAALARSGDEGRRRLLARLEAGAELQLLGDPAVGRYGCVVETASVRLDARLDTQLAALERALAADEEAAGV